MNIVVNGKVIQAETIVIETVTHRLTVNGLTETLTVNDKDHDIVCATSHRIIDLYDLEIDEEEQDDDDGELARDYLLERQELTDHEGEQFNDMYDHGDF